MYKLWTIILMLGMSFSAVTVETRAGRDLAYFASGELHHIVGEPESSVRDYLKSIRHKLGHENANGFPLYYHKHGKYGTGHFSFQQTYNGIPVFGRYIRVHTRGSIITSISSNIDDIDISVIPVITESGAMDIIRPNYISTSTYLKYQSLQIYIYNSIPHLVHSIDAVSFEDPWRYMVDAHTGDVVDKFTLIYEEGPAIGSGINLLSETVDTLYVYEGSGFTTIGQDIVTPYLLCEEYCFDYGDCGGDNYSDCVVSPQQGDCEDGYILDCNGECFNDWYMQFPGVGNGFCNDPWLDYFEEDIATGHTI